MNNNFDIEDLIKPSEHEHILYMNIDARSYVKYVVHCQICGLSISLGYWSLKTEHRYCVDNTCMHFCPDGVLDAALFTSKHLPVPGV